MSDIPDFGDDLMIDGNETVTDTVLPFTVIEPEEGDGEEGTGIHEIRGEEGAAS